MKKILFLFAITFILASCGADETTQLTEKYQTVDEMHNNAMGFIGYLENGRSALENLLDSAKQDTTYIKIETKNDVEIALEQLTKAHEDMFAWMGNHKGLDKLAKTDMTFQEKMDYLDKELQSITKNNDDCQSSLATAKELLDELGVEVDIKVSGHSHDHEHDHSHDDDEHHEH